MKPVSILILSLLLAPLAGVAQTNQNSSGTSGMEGVARGTIIGPDGHATNFTFPVSNPCPIGLRAQHVADGDLVKTGFAHPKGIGQALHLTLSDPGNRQIAEATIRLRGFTPQGHLSQAAPVSKDANATCTQQLHFTPGADEASVASTWVSGLSAITSVELLSATYTDGSHWAPSGTLSCHVSPDLLMPVHH